MVKWDETPESGLSILEASVCRDMRSILTAKDIYKGIACSPAYFQDILHRIAEFQSLRRQYREQQLQLFAEPNKILESIVIPALQKVDHDLAWYRNSILALSPARGYQRAADQIRRQQLEERRSDAQECITALESALEKCGPRVNQSSLEQQLQEAKCKLSEQVQNESSQSSPPPGPPEVSNVTRRRGMVVSMFLSQCSFP